MKMRKSLLLFVVLLVTALPLLAQENTLEPWVCPDGFTGQTLSVYNWSTYVAEDTIANFEAACGVRVIYDVYESNEAMLARLRGGNPGYDIIVPTDYMISIMIAEGLLEELDLSAIPNVVNVSQELRNVPFDPDNRYSIPYQWGTQGIGYNITAVGREITTYAEMFAYQGRVAWLDDLRATIGIALNVLGYDPNSANRDEIREAQRFLIENGRNVIAIAGDDGQALLERGDADIVVEFSGDIFQIIDACGCDNYVYVIPEEGSVIWIDNMAIPAGAPNKALAQVFIDYILHPQVGADISNFIAYASPNQAAIDLGLIDEALLTNSGIYPSDETRERLFFIRDVPEAEQFYNDAWDEIKILIGR